MKFGPDHYVPVLKAKTGEKGALASLAAPLRQGVTPLLEIVEMKGGKTVDEHVQSAFRSMAKSLREYPRCFLDAREIAPAGTTGAEAVFRRAMDEGLSFTPVTGIARKSDVSAALKYGLSGVAIRLEREDLERGGMGIRLRTFLTNHGLKPPAVDLIMDMGPVNEMVLEGVTALADAFLREVPDHAKWRTFTLAGCAFPDSMGNKTVPRESHALVDRLEWVAWREHLYAHRNRLARLPTFADGCVQHPSGVEGFDPRTMPVSASIRYTRADQWLLVKGQSTRRVPARIQFPMLARRLVSGPFKGFFDGAKHCEGCRLAKTAAEGAAGFGAPVVWRRLGTVHHITMVRNDLTRLPWP